MLSRSDNVIKLIADIKEIAACGKPVLIEGETGVGKEWVARSIHESSRRSGEFAVVHCGGLNDSLLSSQLFGHRRGAFKDAYTDHQGLFEHTRNGTLYLDGIGELPACIQSGLLRVLQDKEIIRIGENLQRTIDVRVIAATDANLLEQVQAGRFRADLFYRLSAARLLVPPLRRRRNDIPLMIEHFLNTHPMAKAKGIHQVDSQCMELLCLYNWPGNVSQLKNTMEFAIFRSRDGRIRQHDLPVEIVSSELPSVASFSDKDNARSRLLLALEWAKGNRTKAAKILGIGRATLYRRMADLNIN